MENYDVAMLVGHNVIHYNDSLKRDNVHESFEPHSKVFQDSHLIFSSIIRARFSSKFTKSQWQKKREQTCIISFRVIIACVFAQRKSAVVIDFAETRIATLKRNSNQFLSVCEYVKKFANGINYIEDSGNEI